MTVMHLLHHPAPKVSGMDDDDIGALVRRLARRQADGGHAVERVAILAAGADFDAVVAWITAHAGTPEAAPAATPKGGLHGGRGDAPAQAIRRFVFAPGALADA